jgi:hypothetical protein
MVLVWPGLTTCLDGHGLVIDWSGHELAICWDAQRLGCSWAGLVKGSAVSELGLPITGLAIGWCGRGL